MSVWEDVTDIGGGLGGLLTDVPSLIGNVAEGDVHGIVTDGRNVVGNVADVLNGMEGLGVTLGEVPKRYLGNIAKIADSKILAAAQLAIDGQKALTGDGEPEDGRLYRESATRLDGALNEVIDANVADDRWDGAAAREYQHRNNEHRKATSATSAADAEIASILETEAGQVARTRNTLDDTSQALYDFGLATSWMMFVPPLIPAKIAADTAAAASAMAATLSTMTVLLNNAHENAGRIRGWIEYYNHAAKDTSGEATGCGGGILEQEADLGERPSRISDSDKYEVPDLDPDYGPPATPYGAPGQLPMPAGAPPSTPTPSTLAPQPPVGTAPAAAPVPPRPASPSSPAPTARPPGLRTVPTPAAPAGAGPGPRATGQAPLSTDEQPPRTVSNRDAN